MKKWEEDRKKKAHDDRIKKARSTVASAPHKTAVKRNSTQAMATTSYNKTSSTVSTRISALNKANREENRTEAKQKPAFLSTRNTEEGLMREVQSLTKAGAGSGGPLHQKRHSEKGVRGAFKDSGKVVVKRLDDKTLSELLKGQAERSQSRAMIKEVFPPKSYGYDVLEEEKHEYDCEMEEILERFSVREEPPREEHDLVSEL